MRQEHTEQQTDERFMHLALEEASEAFSLGEVPVGAVLVAEGRVIARAHNRVETLQDPTAHAEIMAIGAATNHLGSKFLVDCTLYVTLEPCAMCAGAIAWARIGRVVFGAPEEKFGYRILAPDVLQQRCKVTSGVLAREAASLMQSFFATKR